MSATRINTGQLMLLANTLGACFLNGVQARLEPTRNLRLARVVAQDGRSVPFNWSVAQHVITRQGGRFQA